MIIKKLLYLYGNIILKAHINIDMGLVAVAPIKLSFTISSSVRYKFIVFVK